MNKLLKTESLLLIITFLFFNSNKTAAQSFGFGCLGLSGIYGGYSYQDYKADGLNAYINSISANNTQSSETFKRAEGLRVGANIFRAKFEHYFITLKGFYQLLKETKTLNVATAEHSGDENFLLKLDHWGFGIDFGLPIFSFLDWKLVEGGVTFYNINFRKSYTPIGEKKVEVNYSESKSTVGYYAASGLIIHLIKDYISIEGTAIYNFITIPYVQNKSGLKIGKNLSGKKNFIEKGGLGISVQLNLGFPL